MYSWEALVVKSDILENELNQKANIVWHKVAIFLFLFFYDNVNIYGYTKCIYNFLIEKQKKEEKKQWTDSTDFFSPFFYLVLFIKEMQYSLQILIQEKKNLSSENDIKYIHIPHTYKHCR